jgi:hypothetical protein
MSRKFNEECKDFYELLEDLHEKATARYNSKIDQDALKAYVPKSVEDPEPVLGKTLEEIFEEDEETS